MLEERWGVGVPQVQGVCKILGYAAWVCMHVTSVSVCLTIHTPRASSSCLDLQCSHRKITSRRPKMKGTWVIILDILEVQVVPYAAFVPEFGN